MIKSPLASAGATSGFSHWLTFLGAGVSLELHQRIKLAVSPFTFRRAEEVCESSGAIKKCWRWLMSDFFVVMLILGGAVALGMMFAHLLLDWWEDNNP
ncbi:hypothetical protein Pan2_96 [Pseudanabaena phage Pan2]|nr:hypothetical protein Pan2_96 [Pseudanabaena phage Pan2]